MRYMLDTDIFIYAINERLPRVLQARRPFLASLEVAEFDTQAAEVAGPVRAWLASQGTPIGPYHSLIAAQLQALGVALVANNTREFEHVPGLKLEIRAV